LQLTIGQRLFDDTVQNVLYYRIATDPATDPAEEDLTAAFLASVIPDWLAAVTTAIEFDCIQAQKVSPDPVRNSFDSFLNLTGDQTGDSLPSRNCGLIQKFNPTVTGKGKKGRVYISGIAEDQEELGRLKVSASQALTTLAGKMTDNLAGPDAGLYEPVWVTRGPPPASPITGFVVWTNSQVKPIMASQKRRVTPINSFVP